MGEEFLNEVSKSGNVCGIKESSGDINRVHLLAYDYPNIGLYYGMDDQALEFFAWGGNAGFVQVPIFYRKYTLPCMNHVYSKLILQKDVE